MEHTKHRNCTDEAAELDVIFCGMFLQGLAASLMLIFTPMLHHFSVYFDVGVILSAVKAWFTANEQWIAV